MRNYLFTEKDTGVIYIVGIKTQPVTIDQK